MLGHLASRVRHDDPDRVIAEIQELLDSEQSLELNDDTSSESVPSGGGQPADASPIGWFCQDCDRFNEIEQRTYERGERIVCECGRFHVWPNITIGHQDQWTYCEACGHSSLRIGTRRACPHCGADEDDDDTSSSEESSSPVPQWSRCDDCGALHHNGADAVCDNCWEETSECSEDEPESSEGSESSTTSGAPQAELGCFCASCGEWIHLEHPPQPVDQLQCGECSAEFHPDAAPLWIRQDGRATRIEAAFRCRHCGRSNRVDSVSRLRLIVCACGWYATCGAAEREAAEAQIETQLARWRRQPAELDGADRLQGQEISNTLVQHLCVRFMVITGEEDFPVAIEAAAELARRLEVDHAGRIVLLARLWMEGQGHRLGDIPPVEAAAELWEWLRSSRLDLLLNVPYSEREIRAYLSRIQDLLSLADGDPERYSEEIVNQLDQHTGAHIPAAQIDLGIDGESSSSSESSREMSSGPLPVVRPQVIRCRGCGGRIELDPVSFPWIRRIWCGVCGRANWRFWK